jgi:hypothetical protein
LLVPSNMIITAPLIFFMLFVTTICNAYTIQPIDGCDVYVLNNTESTPVIDYHMIEYSLDLAIFSEIYSQRSITEDPTLTVLSPINREHIQTYVTQYNNAVSNNNICLAAAWFNLITARGLLTSDFLTPNSRALRELYELIPLNYSRCYTFEQSLNGILIRALALTNVTTDENGPSRQGKIFEVSYSSVIWHLTLIAKD